MKKAKAKKGVKKSFWNGLNYGQKGAIIGISVAILFHIYFLIGGMKFETKLFTLFDRDIIVGSLTYFPSFFVQEPLNNISIITFIVVTIWYGLIGLFLGFIYSVLKNKVSNNVLRRIIFSIIFLGIIIIIYYINLYTFAIRFSGVA
mgnify:CR=1 FL=1